ncbi:MAG UNVERIFIED_CONTAM: hypothetical protein LVT10_14180 [Anaerolineae bacterium]
MVEEAVRVGQTVWGQFTVTHPTPSPLPKQHASIVMDRCIKIEHARLAR